MRYSQVGFAPKAAETCKLVDSITHVNYDVAVVRVACDGL
jgi:hypothetical protein